MDKENMISDEMEKLRFEIRDKSEALLTQLIIAYSQNEDDNWADSIIKENNLLEALHRMAQLAVAHIVSGIDHAHVDEDKPERVIIKTESVH